MTTLRLGNPTSPARQRYDDLTNDWDRIDLERYAIALTHRTDLHGASKIRLVGLILHTEFSLEGVTFYG